MSQTAFDRSIGALARDALSDLGAIISKEVRLGRAEVAEKVDRVADGISGIALGAALLIPGVTLVLFGAANGLATIDGVPLWAATLGVGVASLIVGYILYASGRSNIRPGALAPSKTVANVKADAAAVKGSL